jgi:hypothetical protein
MAERERLKQVKLQQLAALNEQKLILTPGITAEIQSYLTLFLRRGRETAGVVYGAAGDEND